jgi:outer membrane protein assembly factor BamB
MNRAYITSIVTTSLLSVSLFVPQCALAADWPQFRGPNGDGTTDDKIMTTWPDSGPKVMWKQKIGPGIGSVALVGTTVFVMAEQDKDEACIALDRATGKQLWLTKLGKTIFEKAGGIGPRSTPTVVDGKVYIYGTYLLLSCLDAQTGQVVWQHDIAANYSGQTATPGIIKWGNAQSVIVEDGVVMVAGGGPEQTFLFFDAKTGKELHKTGTNKITHGTPTATTIDGQRQVIFFAQEGLVSYTNKGEKLWSSEFPWATASAISPIVDGNIVFISAGYGMGSATFRVEKKGNQWQAETVWRKKGALQNQWSTPVLSQGHLYGFFGHKELKRMPMKCVELATGVEKWSEPGFGQGGTIKVGDNILALGDQGQLVLVKATPEKYTELARAQILSGDSWNHAAVANGFVVARSKSEIVCLDLNPVAVQ